MSNDRISDLKTTILDTAENRFMQSGVRSVSVDDLCNALRISKKTFYALFAQKEELLKELLRRQLKNKTEEVWAQLRGKKTHSAEGAEANVIDHLCRLQQCVSLSDVRFLRSDKALGAFESDVRKYYPEIHKQHLQHIQSTLSHHIFTGIETGISEGLFHEAYGTPIVADLMACQLMSGIRYIVEDCHKASDKKKAFFLMIESNVKMLSNEKGLNYYNRIQTGETKTTQP